MTKYDWSKVTKHVNWIATDANGFEMHFSNKPRLLRNMWYADGPITTFNTSTFKGDWRNSLEMRPDVGGDV